MPADPVTVSPPARGPLARAGLALPLACSATLIAARVEFSDIGAVRHAELTRGRAFEYPALARPLYLLERAINGTVLGISLVNVVLMAAAAIAVALVLRGVDADLSLWTAAPILVLAGQNWDTLTALTILLGLRAWLQDEDVQAGLWLGIGTAFKLVPGVALVPLLAARGLRKSWAMLLAAVGITVAANVPLAVRNPTTWWFPYKFASQRADHDGTIWAAFPVHGATLNLLSVLLLLTLLAAVFTAVARRRLSVVAGCVLAVLAFIASNKVWQPHYVLWALPLLALAHAPHRPVRAVEWTSLAWFAVLWRNEPLVHAGLWAWTVGSARLLSLIALAVIVVRSGRTTQAVPR